MEDLDALFAILDRFSQTKLLVEVEHLLAGRHMQIKCLWAPL